MKVLSVEALSIPDIKAIRFARFRDSRGYFTEPYRKSDFSAVRGMESFSGGSVAQINESVSNPGVLRGLHFQWSPFMGKLVRTLSGHMIDVVMDIRKGSPTLGKIIAYDMPASEEAEYSEWIWVPPGFAHGNIFPAASMIEYLCTGEYSPGCEAGISPLSPDLDWSLCDPETRRRFDSIAGSGALVISDKDRQALTLGAWLADPRSERFIFGQCGD